MVNATDKTGSDSTEQPQRQPSRFPLGWR